MKLASDFWRSKTTWVALSAVCIAMADVAAKGDLDWQSALVALVGLLGATLRDTMARGQEQARFELSLATSTLKASTSLNQKSAALLEASQAMVDAANPRNVETLPSNPMVEPDGEADRPAVTP